uniref:Uncharacterized protein n=1 Tax=Oryza glumipatula TaxID=40148 RepID=A0A0D9YRS3_9ORYZ
MTLASGPVERMKIYFLHLPLLALPLSRETSPLLEYYSSSPLRASSPLTPGGDGASNCRLVIVRHSGGGVVEEATRPPPRLPRRGGVASSPSTAPLILTPPAPPRSAPSSIDAATDGSAFPDGGGGEGGGNRRQRGRSGCGNSGLLCNSYLCSCVIPLLFVFLGDSSCVLV